MNVIQIFLNSWVMAQQQKIVEDVLQLELGFRLIYILESSNSSSMVYPQKDRNGKRPLWKKSMGIKTTVHSKTA